MMQRPAWWQYGIALNRSSGKADAAGLFNELPELLERLGGDVQNWFFMRKPPDVRLRVCATAAAHRAFHLALEALAARRLIREVGRTQYEAQVALFGGPLALELVHDQFTQDSATWLALARQEAAGVTVPWLAASLISVNALLGGALTGPDEAWEVWCALRALRPSETRDGVIDIAERASELLRGRELIALRTLNRSTGTGLKVLADQGQMMGGIRAVLTNTAHFHFNRWGLKEAPALIATMVRELDPSCALPRPRVDGAAAQQVNPRV